MKAVGDCVGDVFRGCEPLGVQQVIPASCCHKIDRMPPQGQAALGIAKFVRCAVRADF
jgi:hypothetical protein